MKYFITLLLFFFIFNVSAQNTNQHNYSKPLSSFLTPLEKELGGTKRLQKRYFQESKNAGNSKQQEWDWAANAGLGAGLSIAVDNDGNTFLTGLLGENTFIKYDAEGTEVWAKSIGFIGRAVSTDLKGNAYLLVDFTDSISFGDSTIYSKGNNVALAKYNPDGELNWVRQNGRVGAYSGNSLVVDRFGNCFIAGQLNRGRGEFVAKFDAKGRFLWHQPFYNTNYFYGYNNLAVDYDGNLFIVGNSRLESSGSHDAITLKLGGDGELLWARKFGGAESDFVSNIAVDHDGNSYITGGIGSNLTVGITDLVPGPFVAKYNSQGKIMWVIQDGGLGVGVDHNNNVYALSMTTENMTDVMLVSMYDKGGELLTSQKAGGDSWKFSYAFTVDGAGNSYVTGEYVGLQGGPGEFIFGDTTIYGTPYTSNYYDSFVAKLGSINSNDYSKLISKNGELGKVRIYPTRADRHLTIAFDNEINDELIEIVIYNSLGKECYRAYSSITNQRANVDLRSVINKGLHYLKIQNDQNKYTFRFLKL